MNLLQNHVQGTPRARSFITVIEAARLLYMHKAKGRGAQFVRRIDDKPRGNASRAAAAGSTIYIKVGDRQREIVNHRPRSRPDIRNRFTAVPGEFER